MSRNERVSCESCTYYIYDEDYESYVCDKNMDEDEYIRLNMQLSVSRCSILLIV